MAAISARRFRGLHDSTNVGDFFFAPGVATEDQVMEVALDAGAEDVISDEDGSIEVTCAPEAFDAVSKAFEAAGLKPEMAEITWKPTNETHLAGEEAARMQRLIDALDELDDVQQVYCSASLIFRTKNKTAPAAVRVASESDRPSA